MAEYKYIATAIGYRNSKIVNVGASIVSSEPLVNASWYSPVNDEAKKAWKGKAPKVEVEPSEAKQTNQKTGDPSTSEQGTSEGDDSSNDDPDSSDDKTPGVNPEKVMEAYDQLDHSNDDQWTKKGAPKLSALNKFYSEGELSADDIKPFNLKRVKAD